jgi:transcriptional regulator with XRE-family HTH domain
MIDISHNWTATDIRQLLETHGLHQRELARMLGIEPMTVSKWVNDRVTPSRITSVALTYLALDLAGKLKLRK